MEADWGTLRATVAVVDDVMLKCTQQRDQSEDVVVE